VQLVPQSSVLGAALCVASCGATPSVGLSSASSSAYYRVDSNDITVWSPRLRVAGNVGDGLEVEGSYAIDAWSGASIDVVTAATHAIHEVRHELNAGARYALGDLTFGGSYRYSTEPDYLSNGGVGQVSWDLAQNNTTLAVLAFGSRDIVGRASDPQFARHQRNLGARVALTQVLDARSLVQISWESALVHGYQASPYRYVAVGGLGTCASEAPDCVPEQVPEDRTRHALVARGRRALGEHVSLGGEYRYYFDSWRVASQTLAPDARVLVGEHGTLELSYRYYTQREADFYRPRYFDRAATRGYVTRDRELSALYTHRVALAYQHAFEVGETRLTTAARTGFTRYRYLAFVGLEHVHAVEATLLLGLELR
jgi:hypothetical protein